LPATARAEARWTSRIAGEAGREAHLLLSRRDFVKHASLAFAVVPPLLHVREVAAPLPIRIGMTDWNLGKRGDVAKVTLARQIGLDGIQVSLTFPTDDGPHLRDPKVQQQFKQAALDNGIQICSLAIGSPGKSRLPLHTNPAAAVLLVEAIEVARNIGTNNILLPILGDSHINMEDRREVDTFVAMMKEVARYAEKAGVVVALEDWISAEDNIRLLDAIGSDFVGVYYDARNIKSRVHDPYGEPTRLGKRIHQVHVKNGSKLMRETDILDWPRLAQEFFEIGYRGWYVLETEAPSKDLIADTRANIEYVRTTFKMPPA
jgi:sugar phosphate isomerase/epimerase